VGRFGYPAPPPPTELKIGPRSGRYGEDNSPSQPQSPYNPNGYDLPRGRYDEATFPTTPNDPPIQTAPSAEGKKFKAPPVYRWTTHLSTLAARIGELRKRQKRTQDDDFPLHLAPPP
jgi:hypothetical protein